MKFQEGKNCISVYKVTNPIKYNRWTTWHFQASCSATMTANIKPWHGNHNFMAWHLREELGSSAQEHWTR